MFNKLKLFLAPLLIVIILSLLMNQLITNLVGKSESPAPTANKTTQTQLKDTFAKLPLSFEANHGQVAPQVNFVSRGRGYTLFLAPNETVLTLRRVQSTPQHKTDNTRASLETKENGSETLIGMQFAGANPKPEVAGLNQLAGKANYFISNDSAKWFTDIPTYAQVIYRNLYPGIDLIYYGNQERLEYDFVLAPGANPKDVILDFPNSDEIEVSSEGELVLHINGDDARFQKPVVYQEIDGARQEILGNYALKNDKQVAFQIGPYDVTRPLVIDPVFVFSTYLGGNNDDNGRGITMDSTDNIYVTGETNSPNFPTTPGAFDTGCGTDGDCNLGPRDAFITKLNPTGSTILYSTYIGGSNTEDRTSIAVDNSGNAYIAGNTTSSDFPTVNPQQPNFRGRVDAFITKLNSSGSALVYSTYLGGDSLEEPRHIAVDTEGNAYLIGSTISTNFPIANALQPTFSGGGFRDAFVTKLNSSGSALVYSTYLGGSGEDRGLGLTVDSNGNAYLTGETNSPNFPTTPGAFDTGCGTDSNCNFNSQESFPDIFITKINPAGSALVYSTYIGGSRSDGGAAIAVDANNNTYVTGLTLSTNFPTVNPLQPTHGISNQSRDAFVTKLNSSGSALVYSTYLGGSGEDSGLDITVDADGSSYITGQTIFGNYPTFKALQATCGDGNCNDSDAFVTKINPAGSALVYSSYLGGNGGEAGTGIAVDSARNAYLTGETRSVNFPTANPLQPAFASDSVGLYDAFVVKISDPPADLSVSKTDSPDPITLGNELTYTVQITNNGPSQATNVMLNDTLPSGVIFISAISSQGSCSGTSIVICSLGTLGNGSSATVTIIVRPTTTGSLANTASVIASEGDLNPTNDTSTENTTVTTADQLIRLNVGVQGQGLVTSDIPGISCHPDCIALYNPGTQVTLTAIQSSGWEFIGWEEACQGNNITCIISMTTDIRVRAVFTRL